MPMLNDQEKALIWKQAQKLGFAAIGVTRPQIDQQTQQHFIRFLQDGSHGDMDWLARRREQRIDPKKLWPEVRSVISLAWAYPFDPNSLDYPNQKKNGIISVYAHGRDYHKVIKKQLKVLGGWLVKNFKTEIKVFVDTAPVMEKPLAQLAGLGWQGKHTNLVSRRLGSWFFLSEIFTNLDLGIDRSEQDHCGSCNACMRICPTRALDKPYHLDVKLCISYLTIEHRGMIPRNLRPLIGNRIYGCDDCLAVCPWNKFAHQAAQNDLRTPPPLAALITMDDAAFRRHFARKATKRLGRDRFIRNVLIAAGNSGDKTMIPQILDLLDDQASIVRASAVWALSQLTSRDQFNTAKRHYAQRESEPMVCDEWIA